MTDSARAKRLALALHGSESARRSLEIVEKTPHSYSRGEPRCYRAWQRDSVGERSLGKQPCQFAGLVQPDKVDGTADVSLADDDLRESLSAEAVAKLGAHAVDVLSGSDLVDRGAATAQAPLGPNAVTHIGFV